METRSRMLDYLYKNKEENPTRNFDGEREKMLEHLKVEEIHMEFNAEYLHMAGLIKIDRIINQKWKFVKITRLGMDEVERYK